MPCFSWTGALCDGGLRVLTSRLALQLVSAAWCVCVCSRYGENACLCVVQASREV